jgi:hypothetical protein
VSASHCPRWIRDLLYRVRVEVVSEPERLSEQYVHGSGGVVGVTRRYPDGHYGSTPLGRFTLGTTYRHVVAFWVRDEDGNEDLIRVEGEFAPVRVGHSLTLFVAQRGRREGVLVGFVNHATRRHHRLRSGRQTLELLGLPTEETWREAAATTISTSLRRSRERALRNASLAAGGGIVALFVGSLVALIAAGNSAPVGIGFGVLLLAVGAVAGLIGVVQWVQTSSSERPRGVLRHRDYGEDFEDFYHAYRRRTLSRSAQPNSPAIEA